MSPSQEHCFTNKFVVPCSSIILPHHIYSSIIRDPDISVIPMVLATLSVLDINSIGVSSIIIIDRLWRFNGVLGIKKVLGHSNQKKNLARSLIRRELMSTSITMHMVSALSVFPFSVCRGEHL